MKFFSDKTKIKLDEKFTKVEARGFNWANKFHKLTINACVLFVGYQIFAFLKEYNSFFLNARQIKKMEEFDPKAPINRKINDED
jgi:hypothetical protein